ncbi:hypothetical protein DAI22_11g060600 [Oryza sativa Japonica Group]|nr:hypothetical protein DAI22_11g060600 [Oryza sativa Japonica Group]
MECPFTQQQTDEAEKLQQKGLRSAVLTTLWEIWMERNNRIFREKESTASALASKIIDELHLWKMAGAKGVKCIMLID